MSKTLSLLALVFFGPILLAAIAYYGPWEWAPRAAHGRLIEPPLAVPAGILPIRSGDAARVDASKDAWFLIYARTSACSDECLGQTLRLLQVKLALAEDSERLRLVSWLSEPPPSELVETRWITVRLDDSANSGLVDLLGEDEIRDGRVYVADPLGNLVMSYPPDAEQKGMLEDIERFLELSTIAFRRDGGGFVGLSTA